MHLIKLRPQFVLCTTLVLALTSGSCASDAWDLDEGRGEPDPRLEALRDRLNITVMGVDIPNCAAGVCTPAHFAANVLEGCQTNAYTVGTSCQTSLDDVHERLCAAETLLRVAQAVREEEVPYDANNVMTVPPQDTESQAELARLARHEAFLAGDQALDALNLSSCPEEVRSERGRTVLI